MKLGRRNRTHGPSGRPLIELGYASVHDAGAKIGETVPIAYLVVGASAADQKYVREWLEAVKVRGHSVGAFLDLSRQPQPRPQPRRES